MTSVIKFNNFIYTKLLKRIIFLFNSELLHEWLTLAGAFLGKISPIKKVISYFLKYENENLQQKIAGIEFKNPVGLAAGFDYNAKLTKILPALGFGFETVGTITNKPYGGNPKPRLARLPKSKSLMVNKGFKNIGIDKILKNHKKQTYEIPVGLSIGKTNSLKIATQNEAVEDILNAFEKAQKSHTKFAYYELNISCPNLSGNVSFYPPRNLKKLLTAITELKLKKPLFIKMPIEKTDKEILSMLKVISFYPVNGVVFGNLQKNRNDPGLDKKEVKKYKAGNFSGKPTEKRSNELIKLAYKRYGKKLTIIGCGGIFNGKDAYKKIRLGASLVQFITGLIFEGPQLAAQINYELSELLKKDGFNNVSEAIGADV